MKKILIMALSLCMVTCVAKAEEKNDTTIIVNKPNQITINQSENTLSVKVNGNEENPNYLYSTSFSCGEDAVTITEEKSNDFNFNIPFVKNKKTSNYEEGIKGGSLICGTGLVNAINCDKDLNIDMEASYEFMVNNIISWDYRPWKSNTLLSVGIGVDWKNFRLKNQKQFIKEGNNIVIGNYPEDAGILFSRIKIISLTVPLTLTQQLNRNLKIGIGPVLNSNFSANLKTRYRIDGKKVKITERSIHQTPVTVDFLSTLSFRGIGIYFKYSPYNVLNTDYGPKFSSISTGLILLF